MMYSIQDIKEMAEVVANSGLCGTHDVDQVSTLMLLAQAEGQHPMVGPRDYHILKAKPAMKAEAMLSRFMAAGGTVEWQEVSGERCAATFTHPSCCSQLVEWTMKEAKEAGLLLNPLYKKFPQAMLKARVSSDGPRLVFPVAVGIYTPEEVSDFGGKADAPSKAANPAPSSTPSDRMDQALEKPFEPPAEEPSPEKVDWVVGVKRFLAKNPMPWPELREHILVATGETVNKVSDLSPELGAMLLARLTSLEPDEPIGITGLRAQMKRCDVFTPDVLKAVNATHNNKRTKLSALDDDEVSTAIRFVGEHAPVLESK